MLRWAKIGLMWLGTLLVPVLLLIAALGRNKRLQEKVDDLDGYKKTRQQAENADRSVGDVDADRDWLHDRAGKY